MDVTPDPAALRGATDAARRDGRSVGFVPTMGALHQGHAALLRRARGERDAVVLSIFVNPLQFAKGEDLDRYPRPLEADLALAEQLGCDLVFTPSAGEMYPNGEPTVTVDPGPLGGRFEGASRPGHFRGVLTVVAKLLNMVGPCGAYFGEKDAQQLALVRRMVSDLDLPVEVVTVGTVREPDGLAMSSRNAYLSPEERRAASVLFEALSDAATRARLGERRAAVLRAEIGRRVGSEPLAKVDHVAIVDEASWEEPDMLERPARALLAARFGSTRLIDNVLLPVPERAE